MPEYPSKFKNFFISLFSSNINDMIDYVEKQRELMDNIFKETMETQKNLEEIYKDSSPNETQVNTSLYGHDLIVNDHNIVMEKMKNFGEDLNGIQSNKYNFQIASLVLFLIITIVSIAGFWIRREYIPWIASLCLLILSAPVFIMAGLETTYTFLSIDFCSSIGNSIISGIIPSENKGIGTYLSCPSKDTMRTISTAIYQYIVIFDELFEYTSSNISKWEKEGIDLGVDKRNNSHFEYLYNTIKSKEDLETYSNRTMILRNLQGFGVMNVLLAELLSMSSCLGAKNSINHIEEYYCYVNHGYMFRNVIFDMLSAIGLAILSVGLNKLIIVMRSHFAKSLRGKKNLIMILWMKMMMIK